jgi:MFS family permease
MSQAIRPGTGMAPVVWALGFTQIVGYGTLYYSFSALAPEMARTYGWSEQWVYGVLSGSLLIGGLVAPVSGAWADRFGAARVMAWGSVGAALALVLCALAPERISFVAGLVAIEVASAFVLYPAAFALLAQVAGQRAQRAITHLTLIAGFASTIFWPLTAMLHEHLSWREVYLIFSVLNLVICLPIHIWLARHASRQRAAPEASRADVAPLTPKAFEKRVLGLMLVGFALFGFVSSAILVHMIPLLLTLGLGGAGVFMTSLFGPAQVLSRLINMQFGKGLSQPALAVVAATLMPAALVVLVVTAPWFPGAMVFAVLFGLGAGLSSIVSGTLPLALFGPAGYGKRLGWISSARLVISSFAPLAFALLASLTSYQLTIWALVGLGALGAASFAGIWTMTNSSPRIAVEAET